MVKYIFVIVMAMITATAATKTNQQMLFEGTEVMKRMAVSYIDYIEGRARVE